MQAKGAKKLMAGNNHTKLRGRIVEQGMTCGDVAKLLNMSGVSFSYRMTGKIDFSQSEMAKIMQILNIPPTDIAAYFFTTEVKQP
jgi:hypothetical protein